MSRYVTCENVHFRHIAKKMALSIFYTKYVQGNTSLQRRNKSTTEKEGVMFRYGRNVEHNLRVFVLK